MFKILIKTILDDFRDENNHLFFASKSNTSRPDIVAYLQETQNYQLLGLILRFSKQNDISVACLIDKYGIKPSQLARLKKGKSFYIEHLNGSKCFLEKVN